MGTGFRDKIQPNKRERFLCILDNRVVLDARRYSHRIGKRRQRANESLRYSARRCDFQITVADKRFHRAAERARGRSTGKIDGQDDRDSQGHSRDRQQGPPALARARADHQSIEEQKKMHFSAG